jgi:AraC-like DNA-binding protein
MDKNSGNLGFIIKRSDSQTSPRRATKRRSPALSATPKLHSVSHYHQRPGCHPTPHHFQAGDQCVELITGGRAWLEIDRQWQELNPGDLLWHIAGDCTIGRSDFNHPYSCLAVRFREGNRRIRRVPRLTRWEDLNEVKLFANQVVHLHADGAFDSHVLLHYILSRLHFQAELYQRVKKERGLPVKLQQVLETLGNRYSEPLSLEELARSADWSIPHLHDRFKEHLGVSPHQALIRRRLQAARELLASTNEPIKSVAGKCGFPSATAFCLQFKRATRLSPKEYRKRQLFGDALQSIATGRAKVST